MSERFGVSTEDAVASTNDDATECKKYAVSKGYWKDEFVDSFVLKRTTPKAPEISRGYYARVMAMKTYLHQFVKAAEGKCQIVSVGAGFDTAYWNLLKAGLTPDLFIEVDFPLVTQQKAHKILFKRELVSPLCDKTGAPPAKSKDGLEGSCYRLISCDLRKPSDLLHKLTSGTDTSPPADRAKPTLFLAECVFPYMQAKSVLELLDAISGGFSEVAVLSYDLINMNDRFGEVMLKNMESRQCEMYFDAAQSSETQKERFLSSGFQGVHVHDMSEIYRQLSSADVDRIERLEFLDEVHLLTQLMNHYCVCYAFASRGPADGLLIDDLFRS